MGKTKHSPIFYLLTGAVSIIFVVTGLRKLFSFGSVAAEFETWGYHPTFMYIIGIVELAGAVALMIPKTRFLAVAGLGVVMLGAIGTHIFAGEYFQVLLPLVLLLLLISLFAMSGREIRDANLGEHDQVNY